MTRLLALLLPACGPGPKTEALPDTGEAPFTNTCLASDWGLVPPSGYWEIPVDDWDGQAPVVSDLDGDGIPDLVVPGWRTVVYRGVGDGSFGPWTRMGYGGAPVVMDVDADGLQDLVLVDSGAFAFYQRGDAFVAADDVVFPTDCRSTPGLGLVGDFNRDGLDDLLVPCLPSDYDVALANGDGTFRVTRYDTHHAGTFLYPADWNGDGFEDVVYAGAGHTDNHLLVGDGAGGFVREALATQIAVATMAAGDFDGDGVWDLVAGQADETAISWYHDDGAGSFVRHDMGSYFEDWYDPDLGIPETMAAGDYDADGIDDIFLAQRDFVWWYHSSPTGHDVTGPFDWYDVSGQTLLADLNGDGIPDAVTVNDARVLSTRLGRGDGSFAQPIALSVEDLVYSLVSDVDGDGRPDLVTNDGALQFWTPSTDGTFQPGAAWPDPGWDAHDRWDGFFSGDFRGDGARQVLAFRPGVVEVLDGTSTVLQPVDGLSREMDVADLDGDGRTDFVATGVDHALIVGLSTRDGFAIHEDGALLGGTALGVGDFTGDGVPDVFVCTPAGGDLRAGAGDGTFTSVGDAHTCLAEMAVGDLDEDGRDDFVGGTGGDLHVYLSLGDGSFREGVIPGLGGGSALVADLTGDGHLDVVLGGLHLLAGTGNGGLVDAGDLSVPGALAAYDFDGDGWDDLLSGPQADYTQAIQVVRNPCGG